MRTKEQEKLMCMENSLRVARKLTSDIACSNSDKASPYGSLCAHLDDSMKLIKDQLKNTY